MKKPVYLSTKLRLHDPPCWDVYKKILSSKWPPFFSTSDDFYFLARPKVWAWIVKRFEFYSDEFDAGRFPSGQFKKLEALFRTAKAKVDAAYTDKEKDKLRLLLKRRSIEPPAAPRWINLPFYDDPVAQYAAQVIPLGKPKPIRYKTRSERLYWIIPPPEAVPGTVHHAFYPEHKDIKSMIAWYERMKSLGVKIPKAVTERHLLRVKVANIYKRRGNAGF